MDLLDCLSGTAKRFQAMLSMATELPTAVVAGNGAAGEGGFAFRPSSDALSVDDDFTAG